MKAKIKQLIKEFEQLIQKYKDEQRRIELSNPKTAAKGWLYKVASYSRANGVIATCEAIIEKLKEMILDEKATND